MAMSDITERKRIAGQIAQERDNFLKIFAAAPVGLLLLDHETVIARANRPVADLILRNPADIIGQRAGGGLRCIHSLEHPRGCGFGAACGSCPLRNGIEGVLAGKGSIHDAVIPVELLIGDKPQARWLSIGAEPLELDGERYVVVAVDDITERVHAAQLIQAQNEQLRAQQQELAAQYEELQQTDQELRESEKRFRTIVEDQTEFICRYLPDGTLTFVNEAYSRAIGASVEALTGSKFTLTVHPADQEIVQRKRAGISPAAPIVTYWHRIVRPSGEIRWQQWTDRGLFNERGELNAIQSVGRDITEVKRAQAALVQRNEELMALNDIASVIGQTFDVEHLSDITLRRLADRLEFAGGWIHLENGADGSHVLRLAAQRGLPPGVLEAIELIPLDSNPNAGPSAIAARSQNDVALSLSAVQKAWEVARRESGPAFAGAVIQAGDKVLGALGVFQQDVRAVSRQRQQLLATVGCQLGIAIENARLVRQAAELDVLRKLDGLRTELIANVSHELRTPLGLITVCATTLLRDDVVFDPATQREFLGDIVEEADRLEKLVDNLLDLSRIQSGRMQLERRPTDLFRLVSDTAAAMQRQYMHHRFVCDCPAEPCSIGLDARRIEQVVRNILSNAAKYSPHGGDITISARASAVQALIQVSDAGVGIPARDLERVFERFYRVERPDLPGVEGVGLGLAVCQGIVEAHGGRIWAESTPGVGSTFSFTLPIGDGVEAV